MLRGLYAAANAMQYRAHEVEITANNIANVSTDGFKRDRTALRSFGDMLISRIEESPESPGNPNTNLPMIGMMNLGGPVIESKFIDFSPGPPRETGNPLDLYLEGPGFFVIESDNGERYTRSGTFTLDAEGKIVNPSGFPLQDVNGQPIRLNTSAMIEINRDGEISQDGIPVGRLRLVEFPDLSLIEKEGSTLFRKIDPDIADPVSASNSAIAQGVIEGSNVDPIDSLIQLIVSQRAYEAAARAVDMFNQSLSRVAGELGRLPG